jgi:hypothetical protein
LLQHRFGRARDGPIKFSQTLLISSSGNKNPRAVRNGRNLTLPPNRCKAKQSEQLVKDYAESWISLNEKAPNPNAAMEKQIYRASCISAAFGLFIALTILCLILVLLAIERNTRLAVHEGVAH